MTRTKILLALSVGIVLLATPAWADFRMERRLALEPGGTFTLDVGRGSRHVDRRLDVGRDSDGDVSARRLRRALRPAVRGNRRPRHGDRQAAGKPAAGLLERRLVRRQHAVRHSRARRRRRSASTPREARSRRHGSRAGSPCARRAAVCASKRSRAMSTGRPAAAPSGCATSAATSSRARQAAASTSSVCAAA